MADPPKTLIPYQVPDETLQKCIIQQYVNGSTSGAFQKNYASFFHHYNDLLQNSTIVSKFEPPEGIVVSEDDATNLACNSHQHLMLIIETIRAHPTCDRPYLHRALKMNLMFKLKKSPKIDQSINVALSLWLTIDFKKSTTLPESLAVPSLHEDGLPVHDSLHDQGASSSTEEQHAPARNLSEQAGLPKFPPKLVGQLHPDHQRKMEGQHIPAHPLKQNERPSSSTSLNRGEPLSNKEDHFPAPGLDEESARRDFPPKDERQHSSAPSSDARKDLPPELTPNLGTVGQDATAPLPHSKDEISPSTPPNHNIHPIPTLGGQQTPVSQPRRPPNPVQDPLVNGERRRPSWTLSDLEGQNTQAFRDWLTFLLQPVANIIPKSISQRVEKYQGECSVEWKDTGTLQSVVNERLELLVDENATKTDITFQTSFTAVNLKRFCGIEIRLLCRLEDHLKFNRELRILNIYPLKGYLHDMKKCGIGIIPDQVIEETILTLNLLFPNWEARTIKFLKKQKNPEHNILAAAPIYYPAPIHLSEFSHWGDRLKELYVEFNSPPPAWKQLWKDRRNPLQWYTFWFALTILGLTTIFGVITSVTAVYSVIYARQVAQFAAAADATAKACPPITCGVAPTGLAEL